MSENEQIAINMIAQQIEAIKEYMEDDKPYHTLIETDILIKTLDEKFKKEHSINRIEKMINHFLTIPKNNRILRLNTAIKKETETSLEYLDRDRGTDQKLDYQDELEEDLIQIMAEIRKLIALIIAHKINEEIRV